MPIDIAVSFAPLKPGETHRVCLKCGAKFIPTARNQKYCHEHKFKHGKG